MAHNNSRDLGDKVVKAIQFVSNRDITIPVTDTKEEENQILFSQEELKEAINGMNTGKSLGLDGISSEKSRRWAE